MRKLKQATQRAKTRRELKEKKDQAEASYADRPTAKALKTSRRNGHATPLATTASAGLSQKITLN